MPSPLHDFLFDVLFSFGNESVFTTLNLETNTPIPIIGYFLLLDNTNFLLLGGDNFTLL